MMKISNPPHLLVSIGHLVKRHAIKLDGFRVVLLPEVDVAHVYLQSTYQHIQSRLVLVTERF